MRIKSGGVKDKQQCPIRLYSDVYEKIHEKIKIDGISFQKLGELLFGAYARDHVEIDKIVKKFTENKKRKSDNINYLDDIEKDELFRMLEQNSPLKDFGEKNDKK